MFKRDFAVLILAVVAIYLSTQQEKEFTFQKAWYHPFPKSPFLESWRLPNPIPSDLNGDGKPEILAALPSENGILLQLIAPIHPGDGFARALVLHQTNISELLNRSSSYSNETIASMSAGYLTRYKTELALTPRKQVIALITSDATFIVLDHNLRLLWSRDLGDFGLKPEHSHVREASTLVTSHSLYEGDNGMIIFGVRLSTEASSGGTAHTFDTAFDREISLERISKDNEMGRMETSGIREVEAFSHFSYFAFEGKTGEIRWKHTAEDFHRDTNALHDSIVPSIHGLHASAQLNERHHFGENNCREYRESVLSSFPHYWDKGTDTSLRLAFFQKHRSHEGAQKAELASLPTVPRTGKSNILESNRKSSSNSIVAHFSQGIEAIHLYSGRTLCRLDLAPQALHVDLNGDGVPDSVRAIKGDKAKLNNVVMRNSGSHGDIGFCYAKVMTGLPPDRFLFNGTICRPFRSDFDGSFLLKSIELARPIAIHSSESQQRQSKHLKGQRKSAIFLNSLGDITSYSSYGDIQWQLSTSASWGRLGQISAKGYKRKGLGHLTEPGSSDSFEPTLLSIALRRHATPTMILAAGDARAIIISVKGKELAWLNLPTIPKQEMIAVDFNLDGYTDIILIGSETMYGWTQVRRPGALPYAALIGALITVMVSLFLAQISDFSIEKLRRSTEMLD